MAQVQDGSMRYPLTLDITLGIGVKIYNQLLKELSWLKSGVKIIISDLKA